MKIPFFLIVLALSLSANSQKGTIYNDTLILTNGLKFVKGATVSIGRGSKSDGSYAYLYVRPAKVGKTISMPIPLTPGWEGYKFTITGFYLNGNETMGKKYYLYLSAGKGMKYMCDPVLATQSKEIN